MLCPFYLRKYFQEGREMMKPSIIPIFIPHIGCPYRCVFCNQWKITGRHTVPDGAAVERLIRRYVEHDAGRRRWEVAFYGGSFTAMPAALQEELLRPAYAALQKGIIEGIRCSTRPDCITEAVLDRLAQYGLKTVELGVQSMDDTVLQRAKRGHTAADVGQATALLRRRRFAVGHQLMPGLPGESWRSLVLTTTAICRLKPDFTRIYPVVVIADTELAAAYRQGTYVPLTVAAGVERAAYMKQAFAETGIPCIRTGLQATEELDDGVQVLGGAYAPAMGEMVDTLRYRQQLFAVLDTLTKGGEITVSYGRRDTSRARGYKNSTKRAAAHYGTVRWQEDNGLPEGTLLVTTREHCWQIIVGQGKALQRY